jgi:uncharacterized protein YndB with AHSA1/START domain
MTEPNTRQIEQTLRVNARPETVWRYWTDPRRMCDWWGQAAELDARAGGACIVDLGGGAVMRGEYIELIPHERIVFTFGWDPHDDGPDLPPGSTRVEVTLTPDGNDTIMTVRHSGIPAVEADRHEAGWGEFLPRLAAAAAHPTDPEA